MDKLKRLMSRITNVTNTFLASLLYIFGISACFILNAFRFRKKSPGTYWEVPESETDLSKQY
jgi:hypothetical protein